MTNSKNETMGAFTSAMVMLQSEFKCSIRSKLKECNMDLTFEMLQVLLLLCKRDGVNQQELANLLHKDKASLTYLIDNLSKRNLVQRTEDPDDRRNKRITLMEEGMRLKEVIKPWIDEVFAIAGKDIPVQEFKDCIALLEKMRANLRQAES